VEWGLRRGCRERSDLDRAFPLGYSSSPPSTEQIGNAERFWDEQGIKAREDNFYACYFGNVGHQLELGHIIDAAHLLSRRDSQVCFVICGEGSRLEKYRAKANGLSNILFPGWVDKARIHVLMQRSAIGLDPLPNRYDFLATVNNKAIEYASAALPIISSPRQGVLFDLVHQEQCGLSYDAGDAVGLANLIHELSRNPDRLAVMSRNSGRVFQQRFTADRVCSDMLCHLERVVEEAPQ